MGNLESSARSLDEHRARRLQLPQDVDFDAYMNERDAADHAKIKPALDFADDVLEFFKGGIQVRGLTLPWSKTFDNFRIRPGEVTLWHGFNGHGKSLVLNHVVLGLLDQDEKACILSFEMRPVSTLARMTRQAIGVNDPADAAISKFFGWCNERLWLYDQHGTVATSRVIAVLFYCAEKLGVTQFVIDSLMKCGISEDDYNGQKRFIDQLCAIARQFNVHIHLVHHSRKAGSEDEQPGKMDAKGSGSITDQVDNVIGVWRNKPKEKRVAKGEENDSPDAVLIVDKQRHGEWEGKIGLWFDRASLQYLSTDKHKPRSYIA